MPAGESARAMATHLRRQAEQLEADAERWERGASGEERVAAALTGESPHTMRVLHDRLLSPGMSDANIDHLVVGVGGTVLVDAKNWVGSVNVHNGSLWQHTGGGDSRRNENRNQELYKVRGMAAAASKAAGHEITPVLCLAATGSAAFGEPQEVKGVTVVPVEALLSWLRARPVVSTPERVASLAVQLSVLFPPAVDPGMSVASLTPASTPAARHATAPRGGRRTARPKPAGRRPARRLLVGLLRPVIAIAAVLALLALGPRIASTLAHRITAAAAAPGRTTPAPANTLSAAAAQRLDDWRIRAGVYEANDQPSTLAYVPDAALGSWADECRKQRTTLTPLRSGLLQAPDPRLSEAAARFDLAARNQLSACMHNDPVGLHHARVAMTLAAAQANARYNVLLGKDPTAYDANHVL